MKSIDPFLLLELRFIQKIIADATRLEAERRGGPVDPHDPAVIATVGEIVGRLGAELRASLIAEHAERARAADQDNPMAA